MRRERKHSIFLYSFLFILICFIMFIFLVDPINNFNLGLITISPIVLFFLFLFSLLFSFFSFLLLNKRRGLLISLFFVGLMIFRFFGFKNLLYEALLASILLLLELFLSDKTKIPITHTPEKKEA